MPSINNRGPNVEGCVRPSDATPIRRTCTQCQVAPPLVVAIGTPVVYTTPSGDKYDAVVRSLNSNGNITVSNGRRFNRFGEGIGMTDRRCRLVVK